MVKQIKIFFLSVLIFSVTYVEAREWQVGDLISFSDKIPRCANSICSVRLGVFTSEDIGVVDSVSKMDGSKDISLLVQGISHGKSQKGWIKIPADLETEESQNKQNNVVHQLKFETVVEGGLLVLKSPTRALNVPIIKKDCHQISNPSTSSHHTAVVTSLAVTSQAVSPNESPYPKIDFSRMATRASVIKIPAVNQLLNEARDQIKYGKYPEAKGTLDRAMRIGSSILGPEELAQVYFEYASVYAQTHYSTMAFQLFDKIIKTKNPSLEMRLKIVNLMKEIIVKNENTDKAIKDLGQYNNKEYLTDYAKQIEAELQNRNSK